MKALLVGIVLISAAHAQRFDAVSVKAAAPSHTYVAAVSGGPGTSDPENFTWPSASIEAILVRGFGLGPYQIVGSGLDDQWFSITAKVPPGATPDGLKAMLINMLVDRFGMKFHHEQRAIPVYELTVAKSGRKFKETDGSVQSGARFVNGVMRLTLGKSTIEFLAGQLGVELERVVIDKTGLTGVYDFQLEYSHEGLKPIPGLPAPSGQNSAPSLFTAVQEQLGLKLESAKDPVDVIVIDSIDKTPTPD